MSGVQTSFMRVLPWLYAGAAVVAVCVYAVSGARLTGGEPLMPVDDAYIHFQYACQFASGEPFVYNAGQAPTSGATSLIYPILLSIGCNATGNGLGLGIWAAALGACGLFVTAESVRRLTLRWGAHPASAALLGFATLGGALTWHAASGMETLLVGGLLSCTLLTFDRGDTGQFAVSAGLLALARPEAAGLAMLAGIAFAGRAIAQRRWRSAVLGLLVPVFAAAAQPGLNLLVTGAVGSSGGQSKSLFSVIPFDLGYVAERVIGNLVRLWTQLAVGMDIHGHWMLPPLIGGAGLLGAFSLLVRRNVSGLLVLVWWGAGFAAIATLDTAFWHFNRYSVPLLILAVPASAAALTRLNTRTALAVSAYACVFALATHGAFLELYRINVQNVARQPLAMARWINANTPTDSIVAVHDVGLIRYLGDRTTLDMVGLTTPDAAESWRNGPGAVGEYLDRFQPDFVAAYTDARGLRYLADSLYGTLLAGFEAPVDMATNVALGGTFQGVYQPDWSGLRTEPPLPTSLLSHLQPAAPVDFVDVADIASEYAHGYTWSNAARPAGFASTYYDLRVAGCRRPCEWRDGGRVMTGRESFTLHGAQGADLMLVSVYLTPGPLSMSVQIDGEVIATKSLAGTPGQFVIVPTRIFGEGRDSELEVVIDYGAVGQTVNPYWHGVYVAAPQSMADVSIQFTGAGVSVEPAIERDGDTLTVSLDWLNIGEARGDYRRFVHVYRDLDQPPVAQSDAYPGDGAFPPAILPPGVTSERVVLDLAQLPPGQYTVALGLYSPVDGSRVQPMVTCCWTVDAERVLIGEVRVGDDG